MKARILSVGAHTSVGLGAEQTAFGLRAGLFCPRTIGHRDEDGEELGAALVSSMDEEDLGWERLVTLALPALREAMGAGGPGPVNKLFLALPNARPGFDEADAAAVAEEITRAAFVTDGQVLRFAGGNDAFGKALAAALTYLEAHPESELLVGGVDSYHHPETYESLDAEFRILSERAFNGFIPGEGAAFVRLAGREAARASTLFDLGSVVFAGVADETPSGELDGAWTQLVAGACAAVGGSSVDGSSVDGSGVDGSSVGGSSVGTSIVPWVIVDQRIERHRLQSWDRVTFRLKRFIDSIETTVDTLAERLGDTGAASGAIALVHATVGLASGFARGRSAVVALGSDSDGRASFSLVGGNR